MFCIIVKDDYTIVKQEMDYVQPKITKLTCLVKNDTVRWYYNSQTSLPFSYKSKLVIQKSLSNTGLYYCYGYNDKRGIYTLSKIKIQVFSKLNV